MSALWDVKYCSGGDDVDELELMACESGEAMSRARDAMLLMLGEGIDLGKLIGRDGAGEDDIEEAEDAAASCFIDSSCFSSELASQGVASFAGVASAP